MVMVLAELGLSRLGGIPGLSAVGAAAILAEIDSTRKALEARVIERRTSRAVEKGAEK